MFAYISGKVTIKGKDFVVVESNGVGYKIKALPTVIEKVSLDEKRRLFTHFQVRENSQELFGFIEEEELKLFELLLKVPDVGPKVAMGVLSLAPLPTITEAIAKSDEDLLTKVSGIGKKTASRIVVDLKGKIETAGKVGEGVRDSSSGDVVDALVKLGYPLRQAREALRHIPESAKTLEEKIKLALQGIGK